MAKITNIQALKILDSRNKTTLEVKITTDDGMMASASVPSGTSTGSFESVSIEPELAINNVNKIIAPKVIGLDPLQQEEIDNLMIDLDGTKNKNRLGANAILGVSLAVAKAGAMTKKMPLYWYLSKLDEKINGDKIEPGIPTPMMVVIEGGKHGKSKLCIQEFLVIGNTEKGERIWHRLEKLFAEGQIKAPLGLEGGFNPDLKYDEEAIAMIVKAVEEENLTIPGDVRLGLDIAANNCKINMLHIIDLFQKWPLFSLEDPLEEDNFNHWSQLNLELKNEHKDYLLIGDDLFVTNKERLEKGIKDKVANAVIIKVNQSGSLTETLKVIGTARKAGYTHIVSHRSGETMDTFIADLAVGTAAKFLKSGAPFASERTVKYNRLKEIAKEL